MAKKKTKRIKPPLNEPTIDDSKTRVLSENKTRLTEEALNQIPWLKDRYLLPGESAADYDLRLKAQVDSIEIYNALDAILVKDIHDEMCEMHRLRTLKNMFIAEGMRLYIERRIDGDHLYDDNGTFNPEVGQLITGWLNGDESVGERFLAFLVSEGTTLAEMRVKVYEDTVDDILLVDSQLARHQKNVRESFKLIEMRRNNALARQRLEQEIERLSGNTLVDERDEF